MITKVYGIKGVSTAIYRFSLGKAEPFKAEFAGGVPEAPVRPTPATFITSRLGQQLAIENSVLFKSGKILLLSVTGQEETEETEAPSQSANEKETVLTASPDGVIYPEVTSFKEAIQVLKTLGVKPTSLRSKEGVRSAAETLGITFPNYAFE